MIWILSSLRAAWLDGTAIFARWGGRAVAAAEAQPAQGGGRSRRRLRRTRLTSPAVVRVAAGRLSIRAGLARLTAIAESTVEPAAPVLQRVETPVDAAPMPAWQDVRLAQRIVLEAELVRVLAAEQADAPAVSLADDADELLTLVRLIEDQELVDR
ncbi:hypothetical protein [Candidatus Nitrospira bockiana]